MNGVTPLFLSGPGASEAFLVARVLFGVVLAFMGLNHFQNADSMSGYAEMKGVPAASLAVPFTGGMLLFGGLGILLGVFPVLAAGAIVAFLVVTTPLMHDFWAVPEDQQQDEMTAFLKNVAMLGAALAFLAAGSAEWAYAVGVGL
ncbi:Uncharacterized membrane protein YphA, DoxX/SURF4 family [Natronoarchaeum philippinense]|uniref:Uncharacterized membrane protein YphA, DoxX/SURF4 family n=1 Tax=Natronoarchaeum philippinense TaxID=558529 RepID=A0A285N548_NATPI|nr:DoxX family membrane protein [Natronoarchaeum philippinense]SNZ04550.1 Uncharacterized membrane protein YphA, DoxX/SURF4 family [Natronoarchaeum philippinense]